MGERLGWLVVGMLFLLILGVYDARGAPTVQDEQECAELADMALVARALAEEKIEQPRARSVLSRIYVMPDERAQLLARLLIDSAYRDSLPPGQFATRFQVACVVNRGNVDSLLGISGPSRPGPRYQM